jgi:endogenous inhibitor of DNA gyrase (YacG/DUF329 family)
MEPTVQLNCPHTQTTIVVLQAFAMFEQIGHKCSECGKVVKIENN